MNEKKISIGLPLMLSLTLILGMIFGYKLKENMGDFAPSFSASGEALQINELFHLIQSKYVDPLSPDSLRQKTISALMAELDPHSVYIPASAVDEMNEDLNGSYYGIGVQFNIIRDTVNILSVMESSPAALAGIQTTDQIIQIDTAVIAGRHLNDDQVKRLIKGAKGSTVALRILRNQSVQTIQVKRNTIKSAHIDAAFMIQPGVAFIRISKFSGNTYEVFMEHLERLKKEGMQELILDLRDNGGGMMDDAIQIADEFISGNKPIVYTKGHHVAEQIYSARRPGLFEDGKLVVLMNENSASASEVLAGALQDWNRAKIVGRNSFGKGLVQEQFTLSDGSAVRLTIARYYTPLGRSIQKPYTLGADSVYSHNLSDHAGGSDITHTRHEKSTGKAIKLPDGRVLYSEEGIRPDVLVSIDSTRMQLYHHLPDIQQKMTEAALSYTRLHARALVALNQGAELTSLLKNDATVQQWLQPFFDSLPPTMDLNRSKALLLSDFEDMIVWIKWQDQGYYKHTAGKDPEIQKAMETLRN